MSIAKPTPTSQIVVTETVEGERPLSTPILPTSPQSATPDSAITPTTTPIPGI